MKRILVSLIVCLMVSSAAVAEQNKLKALWPFGKSKTPTPTFGNINPFGTSKSPVAADKRFAMPSPTAMIDRAEERTGAAFRKTRETWKGVQDLGKSMNPFSAEPAPKKKKSLLAKILPKQTAESPPATVNDFLKMKRPNF